MEYRLSKQKKINKLILIYTFVFINILFQTINSINNNNFTLNSFLIVNGMILAVVLIATIFLFKDFNKSYQKHRIYFTDNSIIESYGDIKSIIPFDIILDIKIKYFFKKIKNIIVVTKENELNFGDFDNLNLMENELRSKLNIFKQKNN